MKIIVDGFGGDKAPKAALEGCTLAVKELNVDILITGDEEKLRRCALENQISLDRIEIIHAPSVIEVEDNPIRILKDKADCSMAMAFKLLAEERGDAFVSGGSTAAIVVGASSYIKRMKGIKRAALAPVIPSDTGCYMLMDAGANLDCKPDMLLHFAIMGSIYMHNILHIDNPRVGLVNIGEEETKGLELQRETYQLLKSSKLNFVGNIEPRDIPLGIADMVVADGFSGNIILKLTEGMGAGFNKNLKEMFTAGLGTKIAAALMMKHLKAFKKKMDYTEYGGAPLMGISKPVIKAHGSSNANAFKNAVRQAKQFVEHQVNDEIVKALAELEPEAQN